ncbi:MAG: response regulator [Pseudomonadota bacterium]
MTSTARTTSEHRVAYVVDDDDDFRRSTVLLLEVSGWATTGFPSAASFLQVEQALTPGPLLLDLRMPQIGGIDLLESGLIDRLRFVTVVTTGHGDIESAVRSLKAGAVDFLEKPFSPEDILEAMNAAQSWLEAQSDRKQPLEEAHHLVGGLTRREMDVLRGLISGLPYKLVAHHLGISARTVEMHREKVIRKLNVRSNAEAVRIGVFANVQPLEV